MEGYSMYSCDIGYHIPMYLAHILGIQVNSEKNAIWLGRDYIHYHSYAHDKCSIYDAWQCQLDWFRGDVIYTSGSSRGFYIWITFSWKSNTTSFHAQNPLFWYSCESYCEQYESKHKSDG